MSQSLVVFPTQETVDRLRRMMDSAPFELDWASMPLEITHSDGTLSVEVDPILVYADVKVLHLTPKQAYLPGDDSGIPARILVAACHSDSLRIAAAHAGDTGHGVEDSLFNWVLCTNLQESRTVRVFLASFGNVLATEAPFSFTNETIVSH